MQVPHWLTLREEIGISTTSEPQLNIYWVFWDILPEVKMPCETPLAFTKVHFVTLDCSVAAFWGERACLKGCSEQEVIRGGETSASYSGAPCLPHWPQRPHRETSHCRLKEVLFGYSLPASWNSSWYSDLNFIYIIFSFLWEECYTQMGK